MSAPRTPIYIYIYIYKLSREEMKFFLLLSRTETLVSPCVYFFFFSFSILIKRVFHHSDGEPGNARGFNIKFIFFFFFVLINTGVSTLNSIVSFICWLIGRPINRGFTEPSVHQSTYFNKISFFFPSKLLYNPANNIRKRIRNHISSRAKLLLHKAPKCAYMREQKLSAFRGNAYWFHELKAINRCS